MNLGIMRNNCLTVTAFQIVENYRTIRFTLSRGPRGWVKSMWFAAARRTGTLCGKMMVLRIIQALFVYFLLLLLAFFLLLSLLFYPLTLLVEELSGEGRWYRKQKRFMEERPPCSNEDFLSTMNALPEDGPKWLTIRKAVADTIGLKETAIHPEDALNDLWRMQWLGPDYSNLIYRIERSLDLKIPSKQFFADQELSHVHNFQEFATLMVKTLQKASAA